MTGGTGVIYSIDELRRRIAPVARKYKIPVIYLFGSYARNEATDNSDVDIMIDREGSAIRGMFDMGGLYTDLCESLEKDVDLITVQTLKQSSTVERTPWFVDNVRREMVKLYEQR